MKIRALFLLLLSVSSLHAADCKYLISNFVGSNKLENYKCLSNENSCYTEQDEYSFVKEILIMPVGLGYGIGLSIKLMDDQGSVVMEHFVSFAGVKSQKIISLKQ